MHWRFARSSAVGKIETNRTGGTERVNSNLRDAGLGDSNLRNQVREMFGQDVVNCYDDWLRVAQKIINGQKNPRGLPQDLDIERWAETIALHDRPAVMALCAKVATGTLFSLMNLLDGSQANHLPEGSRYRLIAEIPVVETDVAHRNETIAVDLATPDQLEDLHELLYVWIRRFSRVTGENTSQQS
jgi:hypothetical protein